MGPRSNVMTAADDGARWSLPAVALVAANLVPLAGVVAWHWPIGEIMLLYWFENVVLGVLNVLRIALAQPTASVAGAPAAHGRAMNAIKFFLVPFFCVHYGIFCLGHGMFVLLMFFEHPAEVRAEPGPEMLLETLALDTPMLIAAAALGVSHGISFVTHYLLGGEYRRVTPMALMQRPYGRIIVLHIAILLGAFAVEALAEPLIAIVILVLGKTALDLRLHRREHRQLANVPTPAVPALTRAGRGRASRPIEPGGEPEHD